MDPTQRGLLECAEQLAQLGSWDWDLVSGDMAWSDNLFRIFGLEPGDVVPSLEYVLDQLHPDDRARAERAAETLRLKGEVEAHDYRIVLPSGAVRHLRAATAGVEAHNGRPRRIVGTVQDLTELRGAQATMAAHYAVSENLAAWESLDRSGENLLRELAEALDCVAATLWVPEGDTLVARVAWRAPSVDLSALEKPLRGLRLPPGSGLAGRAWKSAELVNAPRLLDHGHPALVDGASAAGLASGLAIPAVHREEVLAVLTFYCTEELRPDEHLLRALTGISYELGTFLDRRRGELAPPVLTPRELEVLRLASRGLPARKIAEELSISSGTVRTHLEHIYAKFGVSDRAAAVAKALRGGVIQ